MHLLETADKARRTRQSRAITGLGSVCNQLRGVCTQESPLQETLFSLSLNL